jgi:4-hydroxymandelate oxidase
VQADHRWLDRVEQIARDTLPPAVFRYLAEGARDEITLGEATEAWRSYRLAPRVLRDVSGVDPSVELLGVRHAYPLGISPMTLQKAADPDGEVAMARAAAAMDVPLVVSSNSGSRFADIGGTGVCWWLQAYLAQERQESLPLLRQAVEGGAAAVVLTVDTPTLGTRYPAPGEPKVWEVAEPGWLGANASTTTGLDPADRDKAMDLGPADVAWLSEVTGLPVVVKGVLRAEDARRALEAGARAVWVSNHGGRQLDQSVATAHVLAAVRASAGADAEVYVDGGVRSGLHALVALALGATSVFVGRALFYALAAGGEDGVARALRELADELVEALRLTGSATLADTPGLIADAPFSRAP